MNVSFSDLVEVFRNDILPYFIIPTGQREGCNTILLDDGLIEGTETLTLYLRTEFYYVGIEEYFIASYGNRFDFTIQDNDGE